MKNINIEKAKIDDEISKLQNQASELKYEETLKKIALIENCFTQIDTKIDISRTRLVEEEINKIKKDIKELKNSYSRKAIDDFNNRLTEMYIQSNIKNIKYLNDDRTEIDFCLKFDLFSQVLMAYHKGGNADVAYPSGSLARHNHL